MKSNWFILCIAAIGMVGCGKKQEPEPAKLTSNQFVVGSGSNATAGVTCNAPVGYWCEEQVECKSGPNEKPVPVPNMKDTKGNPAYAYACVVISQTFVKEKP